MNSIFLALGGVGAGGSTVLPASGPFVNDSTFQAQYNNRSLFGSDARAYSNLMLVEKVTGKDGKDYIYYQYLMYKGVQDTAKRDNSVFSVNIITDTFCADIDMMYSLCCEVFNTYIVGNLLQHDSKGNWVWLKPGFDNFASELSKVENRVAEILASYVKSGMLKDMPIGTWQKSAPLSQNNEQKMLRSVNPADVDTDTVVKWLMAGDKVAIIPEYPSSAVQKLTGKYRDLQGEMSRLQGEKENLQTVLTNTKSSLASADSKVQQLTAELAKAKKLPPAQGNQSCQRQLDEILMLIQQQAKNESPKREPNPDSKKQKGTKPSMIFAVTGIAALLLCALTFFLGRCTAPDSDNEDEPTEQTETTTEKQEAEEVRVRKEAEARGRERAEQLKKEREEARRSERSNETILAPNFKGDTEEKGVETKEVDKQKSEQDK